MFYSIQRIILLVRSLLLTIENQPTNNYAYYCSNHYSQTSEQLQYYKAEFYAHSQVQDS